MDLYQVCSNYDPRAKNGPAPGGPHVLHRIMENKKKIFLCESTNHRAMIFWYEVSPRRPLSTLFKIYPLDQKCSLLSGHMIFTDFNRENLKKNPF